MKTQTKNIKNLIKEIGFNVGQTRKYYLDTLYVKHAQKYACELEQHETIVVGVMVKKVRGFNEISIDCSTIMEFVNGVGNHTQAVQDAKKINDYLVSKGFKTNYYNGMSLTVVY